MSQTYTIIAIVGFALAAVCAVAAVAMFFALHIKQVHDDLTGKTAARSIAEIRSRAKTRKRTSTAAKNLGWDGKVSSAALDAFALDEDARPTNDLLGDEGDDEPATTMLGGASVVETMDDDDDEPATSLLSATDSPQAKKPKRSGSGVAVALAFVVLIASAAAPVPALGEEAQAPTPKATSTDPDPDAALTPAASERAAVVRVSLKAGVSHIVVPYGADAQEWINDQDIFQVEGEPDLSHDQVAALFQNGLIVSLPSATYPQPGAAFNLSGIAWGTLTDTSTTLEGGNLSTLSAQAGDVEPWMLDGVTVGNLSDSEAAKRITGSGSNAVLWTSSQLNLSSSDTARALNFVITGELDAAPTPNAFNAASDSIQLPDPTSPGAYPAAVYARAQQAFILDAGTAEERHVAKGQIVRLPLVRYDGEAPSCDGSARIEGGTQFLTKLFASSVQVHIACTDTGDSGLSSAVLQYGANALSAVELARVDLADPQRGSASIADLSMFVTRAGSYNTDNLYVSLRDIAGNEQRVLLSSFADATGAAFNPALSRIRLISTSPQISLTYEDLPSAVDGYHLSRTAVVRVYDEDFADLRARYDAMTPEEQAGVAPVLTLVNDSLPESNPGHLTEVTLGDLSTGSATPEARITLDTHGTYHLANQEKPTYEGLVTRLESRWAPDSDTAPFAIDLEPPVPGTITLSPEVAVHSGVLFAAGDATVKFVLSDTLVGVDESSVAVTSAGKPGAVSFASDGQGGGTATWTIPVNDALVDLSQASLALKDRLGNSASIDDIAAYEDKTPAVTGIVADSAAPVIGVTFNENNVRNGAYYNVTRTATVTLTEATFPFSRAEDPDMVIAVRHFDGKDFALTAKDFSNPSGDGVTWTAHIPCTEDGTYSIEAHFTDLSGQSATPYSGNEFVVDTHAPAPVATSISPHETVQWGWLFAQGPISTAFTLSDGLSGIDETTCKLAVSGNSAPLPYQAANALTGTATWDIPADDTAIALSDVSLTFADRAGNRASIANLQAYENRNLSVAGVFADSAAPVIEVSFDNNDVRNNKYYNAARTATVTLTEASFSFVRDNDPRRTIATCYRDGSAIPVPAEDFENPSGDNITWIAQVPCTEDGVYRIEADFTDPSGRVATPYRGEEFVVDLTAPLALLSFDNNASESGGYFKAARTATVAVYESNFSPDLTSVSTTAADAAGSAVEAPGISGWQEMPKGTWTTSVHFGQELHYSMNVTCTDLAGNVAKTVEEPEFIIDLTAPEVHIERVQDHTAYKDEVAPLVSFSDTNFEPYLADVAIAGSVRGDGVYFASTEAVDATSRTLDYADFGYSLDVDDVYTLTATVRDKAGNESQQAITFSVNRFGSNYELSKETSSLVGSYVKRGSDVVITETNVSGLESSAASVAHNDNLSVLEPGRDFSVKEEDGQGSWSRYTYTLPAHLFEEDGYYRVMLTSRDIAGGLSENLMEGKDANRTGPLELAFAVDGTAPVASLGNVESHTAYYAPDQRVDAYAADNMEPKSARLLVDGAEIASWSAEELAAGRTFAAKLAAADGAKDVRLEVVDRAGNVASTTADEVLITNNPMRYVANTPAILYPAIAGMVIVLAAVGFAAGRVASRRAARQAVQQHDKR